MNSLSIIYDKKFLLHEPQFYHPENASRLTAVLEHLADNGLLNDVEILSPEIADEKYLLKVHSEEHLYYVRDSIFEGDKFLDAGDTYIVKDSWIAALLAAGSGITAVDLVAGNRAGNVFCLVRPPGHHAGISSPMGFCLFNNIAVAAGYAIAKYNLHRIAIVDWDVHHGNGTQEIFYDSDNVFYISLHQYPFYPGTGAVDENGDGAGFGYNMNFPLPARTTGQKYIEIFDKYILNELKNYHPDIIMISAGFDAHKNDPLANMKLESTDFAKLSSRVKDLADKLNVPIISFLEGGYDKTALAESVYEHLNVLKG